MVCMREVIIQQVSVRLPRNQESLKLGQRNRTPAQFVSHPLIQPLFSQTGKRETGTKDGVGGACGRESVEKKKLQKENGRHLV